MTRFGVISANDPTIAGPLVDIQVLVEANFKHLLHRNRLEDFKIYPLDPLQDAHWNLLILDDGFLGRMLALEPIHGLVG